MSSAVALQAVGRTVGNWRLERLLGEGGFGAVYAAENVVVQGRRAAVKVLHAEMALNADIKRRFINEASAASRAEHENIIQVFDAGVADDGTCYIVMELLAGRSLGDTLRLGALDATRTVRVGTQIASALAAAHAIDIVHRDLKPDNVFIVSRPAVTDFVKVLDFGVAKLRGELAGNATKTGMVIGTPQYMSPEQWKGASDLDGRSDVYALGIILFECVAGRLPFSCAAPYEWLYAHLNEPVPDVSTLAPGCPAPLARAIAAMVAKDREQRPQSMAQVIELLAASSPSSSSPSPASYSPSPPSSSPPPASYSPAPSASSSASAPPPPGPHGTAVYSDAAAAAADARARLAASQPASSPVPIAAPSPGPSGTAPSHAARPAPHATRSAIARMRPPTWPLLLIIVAGVGLAVGGYFAFRPAPPSTIAQPAPPKPPAPLPIEATPAPPPDGMVAFAAGTLHMGRDAYGKELALDVPAHDVHVGAFALMRAEVTNREFAAFVAHGDAPAPWKSPRELEHKAALPVADVSHDAAARYCAWKYSRGRLPSESEWEWAARGNAGRLYPSGATLDRRCVNGLAGEHGAPGAADQHACGATPEGLVDLSGNVWEWTASPAAPYPGATVSAPPGEYFVVRGGSFYNLDPDELTATARQFVSTPNRYTGFRCAADIQ